MFNGIHRRFEEATSGKSLLLLLMPAAVRCRRLLGACTAETSQISSRSALNHQIGMQFLRSNISRQNVMEITRKIEAHQRPKVHL